MRSFLVYDQGTPDWVDIFVERCLVVRNADRGKIGMGGMVTLLIMFLGIEIPDNVPALVHNTTIFYDRPTLRRVRFIAFRTPYACSLVIPNGRIVSLPFIPETVFDVRNDDTAETLCNRTIAYSTRHPVEQALVAAGVHIDFDEGGDEDEEEEEEYVPSEEQVYRDASPGVEQRPQWVVELEGRIDRTDGNLLTFMDAYDGDMYNLDTRLQSTWIAQQADIDSRSGQPYVDPRPSMAELETQGERDRAAELEARRSRRSSFSFFRRRGH
jgi:hypothetical protein